MALLHLKLLGLRNKGIRTVSATLMVTLFFSGIFFFVLLPSSNSKTSSSSSSNNSSMEHQDVINMRALSSASAAVVDTGPDRRANVFRSERTDAREQNARGHGQGDSRSISEGEDVGVEKESDQGKDAGTNVKVVQRNEDRKRAGHDSSIKLAMVVVDDDNDEGSSTSNTETSDEVPSGGVGQKVAPPVRTMLLPKDHPFAKPGTQVFGSSDGQPSSLRRTVPERSTLSPSRTPSPVRAPYSLFHPHVHNFLGSNLEILPFQSFPSPFIDTDEEDEEGPIVTKVISWFVPSKGSESVRQKRAARVLSQRNKRGLKACPHLPCRLLFPLTSGVRADVMVFSDVDTSLAPPPRQHARQVYVLHQMTPPSTSASSSSSSQPVLWPTAWRWTFNWTWSYRRDATIWQPLGRLRRAENVPSLEQMELVAEGKSRALAWLSRTCPPQDNIQNQRSQFLEQLRSSLPITDLGTCSGKGCGKGGNSSCSQVLTQQYFFLLALEDYLCEDYVTEVFYRAWQEGTHVIPVVRGGADYSAFFPPGTFVDADWFPSVGHLSRFLTELMSDRRFYAQLLWRKAHWVRTRGRTEDAALCDLCRKLQQLHGSPGSLLDVRRWSQRRICMLQA